MTQAQPGGAVDRLALELLDRDPGDPLADELRTWLSGSARFRSFATANRDKIRKKLRTAGDAESLRDVRAELLAAELLLADRRIELAFEAYGSGKRGPDFTVAFRGSRSFNLEVTRLRRRPDEAAIAATILAKLRQLPPSLPNVLVIGSDAERADADDLATAARSLRARADAKDEAFFDRAGIDGSRGFYDRFLRLGAVIEWCEGADGDARAALWTNASARIALPERAAPACVACLRAST